MQNKQFSHYSVRFSSFLSRFSVSPKFTVLFLLLTLFSFSACESLTNNYANLDENEKKLIAIQDEATAQIQKLTQELQKTTLDYKQITALSTEISTFIKEKIAEVKNLSSKVENSELVKDTKDVLESAQRIIDKVKEVAGDIQSLSEDLGQLASDAKEQAQAKLAEMGKMLDGYKTRLSQFQEKFNEIKDSLLNPEKEPAKEPPAPGSDAATI